MNLNQKKNVFIGNAWPYANGPLHLGHIAALLPGDVIARYHRAVGNDVLFVSGSDCHGTPISVKASDRGVTPKEIAEKYHKEFSETFNKLGFSYDIYTNTMTDNHTEVVQDIIKSLNKKGMLKIEKTNLAYCNDCRRFLPDRYIHGTCGICGFEQAKGDQCDKCGSFLDVNTLKNMKCTICESEPVIKETDHLFYKLSSFEKDLKEYVGNHNDIWRQNAISMSERYIREGIPDRAITRDLDWGISVPIEGFKDKKIYVWFEAVLGYYSSGIELSKKLNNPDYYKNFWTENTLSYYVHGKDNIPFHTIILPSLLMGMDTKPLPEYIISSEYLTIEGKKLSTSRNWAIWANEFLENYDADPLRYFLIMNGPERKDSDFSWGEFVERNNGELLGAYGNLINRTIPLVIKGFGKVVPEIYELRLDELDNEIINNCKSLYPIVGELIENGDLREALRTIFDFIRSTNKYFDTKMPWKTLKEDKYVAANTLKICLDLIANISNMCNPFIPTISEKALEFVNQKPSWKYIELNSGDEIKEAKILVERLDKKIIEEEQEKLYKNTK